MAEEIPLTPESFLRLPEVIRKTGISRSAIYRLAAECAFPKPFRLGPRTSRWRWGEVRSWLENRERVG